jgi:SAM-dependent methyltransferase
MKNATERFSTRVENYVKYRPHYPPAVIECMREKCGLTEASIVADVGSGTGILTELLLQNGNRVYAVEPNQEMREAGERLLYSHERFVSIAATAEATTLPQSSVDLVTAAQAFHWFDSVRARIEFQRILKPDGWVVLVWNERHDASTAFSRDYEQLLRDFATDYKEVNHKQVDDNALSRFFCNDFGRSTFDNSQSFDFESLKGRLLSSSYAPEAGHPQHPAMISKLREIFDAHQVNGKVIFPYNTNVYYGSLT